MTDERWVRIHDADADFSVSESGRVRNNDTGHVLSADRLSGSGYVSYRIMADGKAREFLAHRLVARHFIGEPTGPLVRHLDDQKLNNHFSNLAYGTHAENAQDAIRNGTVGVGVRAPLTHCRLAGHEMSPDNTYVYGSRPYRTCNECRIVRDRKRRARGTATSEARRAS